MQNRNTLLQIAQAIEVQAQRLRAYIPENVHQREQAERQTIAYAGTMLSLASSTLCELYEGTKPNFDLVAVNGVLREWGVEELV